MAITGLTSAGREQAVRVSEDGSLQTSSPIVGAGGAAGAVTDPGSLSQGLATTAVPTYANNTREPLSLDPSGRLRVTSASDVSTIKRGTVTISSATYAIGQSIGGLITISGLVAGAKYKLRDLSLFVTGSGAVTTAGNTSVFVFNENPSGSTFTNTSPIVVAAADLSKIVIDSVGVSVTTTTNFAAYRFATPVNAPEVPANASGNIYIAFGATAQSVYGTVNAEYYIELGNP